MKLTEKSRENLWLHFTAWKACLDVTALEFIVADCESRALKFGEMPQVKQQVRLVMPILGEMKEILHDLDKIGTELLKQRLTRDVGAGEIKTRISQVAAIEHWKKVYKDWLAQDDVQDENGEITTTVGKGKGAPKEPTAKAIEQATKHIEKVNETFEMLHNLAGSVEASLLEDLAENSLKKCGAAGLRSYHAGQALVVRRQKRWGVRWIEASVLASDHHSGKHKLKAVNGGMFSNFSLVLTPWNHAPRELHVRGFELLHAWYMKSLAADHAAITDPVMGKPIDVLKDCAAVTVVIVTTGDKDKDKQMEDDEKKRKEEAEAAAEAAAEQEKVDKEEAKKRAKKGKPPKASKPSRKQARKKNQFKQSKADDEAEEEEEEEAPKKKKNGGVNDIIDVKDAKTLIEWLHVLYKRLSSKADAIAGPMLSEKSAAHISDLSLDSSARRPSTLVRTTALEEQETKAKNANKQPVKLGASGQGTLMLLTADSSCGKTFLLHQLVMLSLKKDGKEVVPIVIRIKTLARRMLSDPDVFKTSWNWVDAYLQLEHGAESELYRMMRQAMMARRALLLFDGLDEGGKKRLLIERHLIDIIAPQGHVTLVTSRPTGYTDFLFEGFTHLSFAPLSFDQQTNFLAKRLGATNCAGVLDFHNNAELERVLDEVPDVEPPVAEEKPTPKSSKGTKPAAAVAEVKEKVDEYEMVTSNPYILSILASVAMSSSSMPETISEVYQLAFAKMVHRVGELDAWTGIDESMIDSLFAAIFFEAHVAEQRVITRELVEMAAQHLLEFGVDETLLVSMLKAFASSVRLGQLPFFSVLQDDGPASSLRVQAACPSFQEYYAAKAISMKRARLTSAPWKWTIWWSNVLTLGTEIGDDFCSGLFYAIGFRGKDELELDLHQRIAGHRETALRAVAQMARAATYLSVSRNQITAREMPIILDDFVLPKLRYLELPNNQIGVDYPGEPLGTRWIRLDAKPASDKGTMLKCDALSKAIHHGKREFTADALSDFELEGFTETSYIKDLEKGWYGPSPEIPPGRPNEGMEPLEEAINEGLLPALRGLEVRGNQLSEDAMSTLSKAIQSGKTPHLTSVITDTWEINEQDVDHINLAHKNLNDDDLGIIEELLANGTLPHCTTFNLVGNDFSLDAVQKLVDSLKQPTYMRWTALQEPPEHSVELTNPTLRTLLKSGETTFSRPQVPEGIERRWDGYVYSPPPGMEKPERQSFLSVVDGSSPPPPCYFQPEQARKIFTLIGKAVHNAIHLNLSPPTHRAQKLNDLDIHLLGHSLEAAENLELLRSIDLSYNLITASSFTHLMEVFEALKIPYMSTLSLHDNRINDEGINALADALAKPGLLDKIEVLDVHNNPFGDKGLNALLDAVKIQGALQELKTFTFGGIWLPEDKGGVSTKTVRKLADLLAAVDSESKPIFWPMLQQLSIMDQDPRYAEIAEACVARRVMFQSTASAMFEA